ncbi:MAG TPA: hypothetical protein VGM41_17475 [Chitinophagaceae bacterium]|jgi:hypothetical protein
MNRVHDPRHSPQTEAIYAIQAFPILLYRIHALPYNERTLEIEKELKEGLSQLNDLLSELRSTVTAFHGTAAKVREL